ncbi:thiamine pyrophosphate-binding protein [Amphibacillus indicireducens]|uniref:Acetolactate synthase n=1 Tax=Amphibacillus indicireducens TaxID=1076330 RepID=A0ABP7V9F5_9BACI
MTTVAQHIVNILEEHEVKYVFGLPGEENITLVNQLEKSKKIKFILVQDERSGAFMASTMGWLSGQPGVVIATLGPGALNMALSIADAQTHSFPLITIAAQGDLEARVRETTQVVDLKSVFTPITKWSEDLVVLESTSEMINKAYNIAMTERKGATFVTIPASLEQEKHVETSQMIIHARNPQITPTEEAIREATELLKKAKKPIILAGLGVSRENTSHELTKFAEKHNIPVATSFMAKGTIPDTSKLSLGVVGFFVDDYINEYLENVDTILAISYDFAEFDPSEINPKSDKSIINMHTFAQETHENFSMETKLIGNYQKALLNYLTL